jgi:Asp-tRNA(Asn)/Glu-tRNA(Gln) amidotransferase A subunit family amidase
LHGIPVIIKDQADVKGMPTTLGSILFENYMPERDCFVVSRLKKAGVIFLGKSTLGELGGGDTHGSLFGSTRNVYDLERTAGGSSGGSGASVSANFCAVAVGQEGFASIRRPSTWNGVAGMRPTMGLVSRTGVYGGWPTTNGSLGPMARTVADLARLLDAMVGYDPDDPVTSYAVGGSAESYSAALDRGALKGARLGILREPIGFAAEPDSEDFKKVTEVFDRAVSDLRKAGAEIIDPIVIPDLAALIAKRARSVQDENAMFEQYFKGGKAPFATREAAMASPLFQRVVNSARRRWSAPSSAAQELEYLRARDTLMINMLRVMCDHRLDAIVHKAVEHQPTLIRERHQSASCGPEGRPAHKYVPEIRTINRRAGWIDTGQSTGGHHLPRPAIRRCQDDSAGLRLRAGNSTPTSAAYHTLG